MNSNLVLNILSTLLIRIQSGFLEAAELGIPEQWEAIRASDTWQNPGPQRPGMGHIDVGYLNDNGLHVTMPGVWAGVRDNGRKSCTKFHGMYDAGC